MRAQNNGMYKLKLVKQGTVHFHSKHLRRSALQWFPALSTCIISGLPAKTFLCSATIIIFLAFFLGRVFTQVGNVKYCTRHNVRQSSGLSSTSQCNTPQMGAAPRPTCSRDGQMQKMTNSLHIVYLPLRISLILAGNPELSLTSVIYLS